MGKHLTKAFVTKSTTITDQGVFSALLAAWTVDRGGEQIRPGAFAGTIKRWQASGKMIPLHWDHSGDPHDIIGYIDPKSMRELDDGLYVEGSLDLDTSEVAREAWRSMKNNAVGLSFGYITLEREEKGDVLHLLELDLFEGSITPAPMNPDTQLLEMKNVEGEEPPAEEPEPGAEPDEEEEASDDENGDEEVEDPGDEEPEGQVTEQDPLKHLSNDVVLEAALGRPVKAVPPGAQADEPEPDPEPSSEQELRRKTDKIALEMALGGSHVD